MMKTCKRYRGWHSSPVAGLGVSSPDKSTEGVGYYIARDRETAKSFGRKVSEASTILCNPLDARGETPYILHESDEVMEAAKPSDSKWLSAVKEAVKKSGTTDENWSRNQACLNQTLTDILQEKGYDGLLIENWLVEFARPQVRAKLKGCKRKP